MIKKLGFICSLIAALAWSSVPVMAGWMMNPHRFGAAAVNGFLQCVSDTSDLTTYTFNNVNIGPYSASRGIIIVVHAEDAATNFSVSSATVGGVTTTNMVGTSGGVLVTNWRVVPHATQPTTSSDTIVVTMSEAITGMAVCVFTIYNNCNGGTLDYQRLNSDVLFDTDSGSMDISDPSFSSGYGFLATTADSTAGTTVYSGNGTEVYDNSAGSEFQYSGFFATTSPAWSATVSGTGDAYQSYFTCGT